MKRITASAMSFQGATQRTISWGEKLQTWRKVAYWSLLGCWLLPVWWSLVAGWYGLMIPLLPFMVAWRIIRRAMRRADRIENQAAAK